MDVTPALAETLDLVEKANAITGESLSPSDELRSLTLGVIGSQSQKRALSENLMLKAQHDSFGKLKKKTMRVDIAHRDGIVSFSLDEGEWKTGSNGDLDWIIRLEGKEHASMAVNSICNSTFSWSGSTLNTKELGQYVPIGQRFIIGSELNPLFGLILPYHRGITVVGAINWHEQNEDDMPELVDSYQERISWNDVDIPDTFRLELLFVTFRDYLIKDIFNAVGCDDLLVTEGNEEPTD